MGEPVLQMKQFWVKEDFIEYILTLRGYESLHLEKHLRKSGYYLMLRDYSTFDRPTYHKVKDLTTEEFCEAWQAGLRVWLARDDEKPTLRVKAKRG